MNPEDEAARAQAATELQRANQARSILDNELVKDALEAIRLDAEKAMRRAAVTDIPAIQAAKLQHEMVETFRSKLQEHVRTGKMAERTMEDIARRQTRR